MIDKIAADSFQRNIEFGRGSHREMMNRIRGEAYELNAKLDKIRFYNIMLDKVTYNINEHLKECHNPTTCSINDNYDFLAYYLQQELESLDVVVNEDTFTQDEKAHAEDKLDKILKELAEVKLGHQIIYDDLLKEIEELRNFYFLGKKKWYQLAAGKFVDMTVSGIVSESVSKDIIEILKPHLNNLIEGS